LELVSLTTIIRNTLYFNRTGSKFGGDFNVQNTKRQSLLVNGFEGRTTEEQSLGIRWNLSKNFTLDARGRLQRLVNVSQFFSDKDYDIRIERVKPKLTFLYQQTFRISLLGEYRESKNQTGTEFSFHREIGTELRYNLVSRSTLSVNFSYVSLYFPFPNNSPVSYAMLEGLQSGDNFLWGISYDRKLGNNVQMTLGYEGRQVGEADAVHIGRAQVRAIF